ncbi:hypothetical protein [Streptomyces sp. RerS4]|uniref:hypothetical protein n=1 Tax=Streptomyces sp. RerS4 TaxID=2942449 RepID=UPI00201C5439|nr:hypothetical protein [Streptomyces sp. RerS4]UQX02618.1 hypothetical protein M4D82_20560 [Streptomyces sp. RerS4]
MPDRDRPDPSTDDNPFAAPPEGRPDQPWEPRQPRHQGGGGQGPNPGGPSGQEPEGPARWDPMDPLQRRARYALLAGMWGFFFGIFGIPSMGLMLGALALYWGISALRGRPATESDPTQGTPARPGGLAALGPAARPQRAAAVSGLVTASLALLLAGTSYAVQLAYKDFYVCRDDALTRTAELKCNTLLPNNVLGDILKVQR